MRQIQRLITKFLQGGKGGNLRLLPEAELNQAVFYRYTYRYDHRHTYRYDHRHTYRYDHRHTCRYTYR